MMLTRRAYILKIKKYLSQFPVVALIGPRQSGKTTLARMLLRRTGNFFDLEAPGGQARLQNPEQALGRLRGLVVLDEIQLQPSLFSLLRVLADRPRTPARFLILGSASPDLIAGVSETLAGRVAFVELGGFDLEETGAENWPGLWLRGGFPRSFLSESDDDSFVWREQFIQTFLTRDLPQLGIHIAAPQMRRFWMMVAHYHGQSWNAAEISGSLGISDKTARHYLDILTGAFLMRQLLPWTENLGKRIRKAPKVYVRDSGLFHSLMGLSTRELLESHPKLGASWEGFALEQILRAFRVAEGAAFFWGAHSGAELDLLLFRAGKRIGFEFKFSDAPTLTKSMTQSISGLNLERLWVVYPGVHSYSLAERVEAVPLTALSALPGPTL
jgi:hypothetical protein